jgi:hypothetical protein
VAEQLAAIRRRLGRRWDQRYSKYAHDKAKPVARPKLSCRIDTAEQQGSWALIRGSVSNLGNGPSYHVVLQLHFAVLPVVIAVPGGPPPPPAPTLRDLLELREKRTLTLQPGESQPFELVTSAGAVMNRWQAVVVCFDPLGDPLPMASWPDLLQPLDNLLVNADDPAAAPPVSGWEEFDGPASTQPRITNRTWHGRSANPDPMPRTTPTGLPLSNPRYFAAGASAATSELRQSISITPWAQLVQLGDLVCGLSAFVRSYAQSPPDRAQVLLEARAGNGATLATLDLGTHENTDAWRGIGGRMFVPEGTTSLMVRLRSIRRSGSNNDGFFDMVRLTPAHRQIGSAERGTVS